jgi:hypothetical protein
LSTDAELTLPAGVSELNLTEFYKFPVGPIGLEPTQKLLSLKDKRVRIKGFMVKEEEPTTGLLMLAPSPGDSGRKRRWSS